MTTSDLAQPAWVAIAIGVGVCVFAIWKGEWPERAIAIAYLVGWSLTEFLHDASFPRLQSTTLLIDFAALAFSCFVALRSNRLWVMCVAAFRILAIITHFARLADPTVGGWAYITAGVMWGYLVLLAMTLGTWGCVRRRRDQRRAIEAAASGSTIPH